MQTDQLERIAIVEAGGTVLCNVRKGKDDEFITWAIETGRYLYIGDREPHTERQQSEWYNPFKVKIYGRAEAIRLYRSYLLMRTDLLGRLPLLGGKVLGCWCYPSSCHGDVLIELLVGGGE